MNENKFEFTYRALGEKEKRTIESIKAQYAQKSEDADAYAEIVKLDKRIKGYATAFSIALGVIGSLIFGLGLTMVLEWEFYAVGILISLVGAVPSLLAYPLYRLIFNLGKKKHGARILELSSQILDKE